MKFAFILIATMGLTSMSLAQTSTYRTKGDTVNSDKTGDWGLGARWGTLTGVTANYWADEHQGFDVNVAFDSGNTSVGADYLYHFRSAMRDLTQTSRYDSLVPYIGAGLVSAFGTDTDFFNRNTQNFALAARVPLGLELLPQNVRLGVFAELGLGAGFVPTNFTFLTADLGARYYF